MTIKIEQALERVPQEELEFFIKGKLFITIKPYYIHKFYVDYFSLHCFGTGNLSLEKSKHKKPLDWLPDQGWEDLVKLAELFPERFSSLPDDVERNPSEWKSVSHNSEKSLIRIRI